MGTERSGNRRLAHLLGAVDETSEQVFGHCELAYLMGMDAFDGVRGVDQWKTRQAGL